MPSRSPQPASALEPRLEPALDFLRHLWRLNHALERTSLSMERRLGVTAQQRLLVRCIGIFPGVTASHLAELLHLDRGTVSVGLARLEAKGLVRRRRDRRDRRRVTLQLSAPGARLARPDPRTVEAGVERLLRRLRPRELAGARRVLSELAEDLEGQAGDA